MMMMDTTNDTPKTETLTMNMNVNVTYLLSEVGQKAAVLAGRPAARKVTEQMQLTDASLIDAVRVMTDGALTLDTTEKERENLYSTVQMMLDAPPADIADLIAQYRAFKSAAATKLGAAQAEQQRAAEAAQQKKDEQAAADFVVVNSLLDQFAAADPLQPFEAAGIGCGHIWLHNRDLILSSEQRKRMNEIEVARLEAVRAEADRVAAAKAAERAAILEKHGGLYWQVVGGMCDFKGYDLWKPSQTRRWVGVFRAPKGIALFCPSPRNEFVFDVSNLAVGDCIQGAGFDVTSRGRRRYETEFFGVVVRNDNDEFVLLPCASRADAFKESKRVLSSVINSVVKD